MNRSLLVRLTIGICLAIILIVIAAYVVNFSKMSISTKSGDWGTFGDYFGGIMNPLIGILNLIILIYITFVIFQNSLNYNMRK